MQIVLTEDMFTNNKCTVSYGNREATFTIIDEEFPGSNSLGRINRVTVLVVQYDSSGAKKDASFCPTIIGLGDGIAGVWSEDPVLRGKQLNRDNMAKCTVELYEDE